ncbi:hypothetical protein [Nocardioides sp. GXQ0305]|uniref:hypothetical protein n=1 Tax=Nocardioides sp. GXQ0305 TaxID=3423912 RepID=UPI003D7D25DD
MYRKHLVVATLPLTALALLGGDATASPTPADFTTPTEAAAPAEPATPADFGTPSETASHRSRDATSLRFLDVRDQVFELDVGDPGASPGDVVFFTNRLRTRDDTANAGRFASSCTQVPGALYQCRGTLLLPDSTIELGTTTDLTAPITASITGGTGAHEGASGQVRIVPTGDPDRSRLQVHLLGPAG